MVTVLMKMMGQNLHLAFNIVESRALRPVGSRFATSMVSDVFG